MVDALKQAARVLRPDGSVIDLRPVAVDAPIEVVTTDDAAFVGSIDGSPGIADDEASDHAVDTVLAAGLIELHDQRHFEVCYYWDDLDEMTADIVNNWSRRHKTPAAGVLDAARRELSRRSRGARLCARLDVKLARYVCRSH